MCGGIPGLLLALLAAGCHLTVERTTTINTNVMRCSNPDDAATCRQEVAPLEAP